MTAAGTPLPQDGMTAGEGRNGMLKEGTTP
jgi:hypothetical protein